MTLSTLRGYRASGIVFTAEPQAAASTKPAGAPKPQESRVPDETQACP